MIKGIIKKIFRKLNLGKTEDSSVSQNNSEPVLFQGCYYRQFDRMVKEHHWIVNPCLNAFSRGKKHIQIIGLDNAIRFEFVSPEDFRDHPSEDIIYPKKYQFEMTDEKYEDFISRILESKVKIHRNYSGDKKCIEFLSKEKKLITLLKKCIDKMKSKINKRKTEELLKKIQNKKRGFKKVFEKLSPSGRSKVVLLSFRYKKKFHSSEYNFVDYIIRLYRGEKIIHEEEIKNRNNVFYKFFKKDNRDFIVLDSVGNKSIIIDIEKDLKYKQEGCLESWFKFEISKDEQTAIVFSSSKFHGDSIEILDISNLDSGVKLLFSFDLMGVEGFSNDCEENTFVVEDDCFIYKIYEEFNITRSAWSEDIDIKDYNESDEVVVILKNTLRFFKDNNKWICERKDFGKKT